VKSFTVSRRFTGAGGDKKVYLVVVCNSVHHIVMKTGIMYRVSVLMILLVFLSVPVFSITYTTGKYKVDLTVRNSAMNLIPGVKVDLYQYDARRLVAEVSAHGYKPAGKVIDIKGNQTFYKYDLVLADLERNFYVLDHNKKLIPSAYIRKDQYGFPGNHYGITVYIPIVHWPVAKPFNVEVFDSFWGIPLKKTCEVTVVEEFYCVKLSITRKDLKWSGSDIYVLFRTKAPNSRAVLNDHLLQLKKLGTEKDIPNGAEEALAGYIADNYSVEEIESADVRVPASLKWLLLTKKRFNELHRE